jgi:hypothetical protein
VSKCVPTARSSSESTQWDRVWLAEPWEISNASPCRGGSPETKMKLATSRSATLPFGQRTSFKYTMRLCRPDLRKASGFRAGAHPSSSSSAQAGRLSLPACAEEVVQAGRPSERQSLSASQAAEPQVVADGNERDMDEPEFTSPNGSLRPPLHQSDPLPPRRAFWTTHQFQVQYLSGFPGFCPAVFLAAPARRKDVCTPQRWKAKG